MVLDNTMSVGVRPPGCDLALTGRQLSDCSQGTGLTGWLAGNIGRFPKCTTLLADWSAYSYISTAVRL